MSFDPFESFTSGEKVRAQVEKLRKDQIEKKKAEAARRAAAEAKRRDNQNFNEQVAKEYEEKLQKYLGGGSNNQAEQVKLNRGFDPLGRGPSGAQNVKPAFEGSKLKRF